MTIRAAICGVMDRVDAAENSATGIETERD
jgi:hypothetical protein